MKFLFLVVNVSVIALCFFFFSLKSTFAFRKCISRDKCSVCFIVSVKQCCKKRVELYFVLVFWSHLIVSDHLVPFFLAKK